MGRSLQAWVGLCRHGYPRVQMLQDVGISSSCVLHVGAGTHERSGEHAYIQLLHSAFRVYGHVFSGAELNSLYDTGLHLGPDVF